MYLIKVSVDIGKVDEKLKINITQPNPFLNLSYKLHFYTIAKK